jgi:hypothetical protein
MKLELTALEAINLNAAIIGAQTRIKGAKLALGMRLAYNRRQLTPIVEALEENRVKLLNECAEKDETGAPVKLSDNAIKLAEADAERFHAGVAEMLKEKFSVEFNAIDSHLFPEMVDTDVVDSIYAMIVDTPAAKAPSDKPPVSPKRK